jgi:hypothetical protein
MKGAPVYVFTVDGAKYITTVADSTEKDNLDSVPRFKATIP